MIPTNMLAGYGPPPIRQAPPHGPPPEWMARNAAIAAVSAHFGKLPPPSMMSQSAYVPGSSSSINSKSGKLSQLREEVTIRNCDSGKSKFCLNIIVTFIPSYGCKRSSCRDGGGTEQDDHQLPESR